MKKRHIAVCVPSLGTVSIPWAGALTDLQYPVNTPILKIFMVGKTVAEARNECVQTVLETEAGLQKCDPTIEVSHIFWLDDDVIVQSQTLISLLQRRKQIVSGVYFTKGQASEPLILDGYLSGSAQFTPGEFREVWGHGMGLTLVEMDVYRRMLKELDLGKDQYGIPAWYKVHKPGTLTERSYGTEDLYFLDLAHKIGVPSYIDQSKDTFAWHFDLVNKTGYPLKQWEEWRKTRTVTWDTVDGPVTWANLRC